MPQNPLPATVWPGQSRLKTVDNVSPALQGSHTTIVKPIALINTPHSMFGESLRRCSSLVCERNPSPCKPIFLHQHLCNRLNGASPIQPIPQTKLKQLPELKISLDPEAARPNPHHSGVRASPPQGDPRPGTVRGRGGEEIDFNYHYRPSSRRGLSVAIPSRTLI